MSLSQLLFSIQGRATRLQFWLYYFAAIIIFYALLFVVMQITGATGTQYVEGTMPASFWIISLILYIPFIWTYICVAGKRCHDRDRSAWFLLVGLIPLVNLWVLVELGFLDGTQGPNRFGPSPKGIGGNQVSNVFS